MLATSPIRDSSSSRTPNFGTSYRTIKYPSSFIREGNVLEPLFIQGVAISFSTEKKQSFRVPSYIVFSINLEESILLQDILQSTAFQWQSNFLFCHLYNLAIELKQLKLWKATLVSITLTR